MKKKPATSAGGLDLMGPRISGPRTVRREWGRGQEEKAASEMRATAAAGAWCAQRAVSLTE
jgi:hypothetical protein